MVICPRRATPDAGTRSQLGVAGQRAGLCGVTVVGRLRQLAERERPRPPRRYEEVLAVRGREHPVQAHARRARRDRERDAVGVATVHREPHPAKEVAGRREGEEVHVVCRCARVAVEAGAGRPVEGLSRVLKSTRWRIAVLLGRGMP